MKGNEKCWILSYQDAYGYLRKKRFPNAKLAKSYAVNNKLLIISIYEEVK